ncbi:hypothetical protein L3X38_002923 [Prunus dulcis]|uniref:Uncharacterized protein n=1 Tax=Prunus dulcis TaxID=3755 RepID=A0AAD4ZKG3_PRUDU|nr:hypothetical protein L3X38_002923 [Prunus dulcis]
MMEIMPKAVNRLDSSNLSRSHAQFAVAHSSSNFHSPPLSHPLPLSSLSRPHPHPHPHCFDSVNFVDDGTVLIYGRFSNFGINGDYTGSKDKE